MRRGHAAVPLCLYLSVHGHPSHMYVLTVKTKEIALSVDVCRRYWGIIGSNAHADRPSVKNSISSP